MSDTERTPLLKEAPEPAPPQPVVEETPTQREAYGTNPQPNIYPEIKEVHGSLNDSPERADPRPRSSSGGGEVNDPNQYLMDSREYVVHTTSNLQSLMHLLKGNIGTGILAMPSALKNAGLWMGFGGLFVMGAIAIHCMHLLVICSHKLCERSGKSSLDYGEVAEETFRGRPSLRRFSGTAKMTINVFLCITQFGFCIVYILFIADNIKQVIEHFTHPWTMDIRAYEAFVLLLLIPYTFIRNLRHLAPFSLIANFATVIGLVIILQYCFRGLPSISERPAFNSWATLPLYFGTAIYAFEGIGVVLPIENKMATPQDFGGLSGVLNTGMVIVTVLYITVGFYGYLKFGDGILGSITLNLPLDNWLYLLVRLIFALAIFVSYGLQFYVPVEILWPPVRERITSRSMRRYGEYIMRVAFAVFTFAVAASIPHLDLMISLIGALASSTLALIFPPILECIVFWPNIGRCKWKLFKNILISLFGFIGFVAGTLTTLLQIVKVYKTS